MSGQALETASTVTDIIAADSLTPERIELVRRTVAKGATDDELAMFFSLANKYQLDPFAKEIYLIAPLEQNGSRKQKNGQLEPATIITGRDGFLAIANRHPAFDGMASDCVFEKDEFQPVQDDYGRIVGVNHHYGPVGDRGKLKAAYALVYRKDRSVPTYFHARWIVYGEPNAKYDDGKLKKWSPWCKYPDAMLVKVPQAYALKQAFSLSGLVAEEELAAGVAIDEGAEPAALEERKQLRTPQVSPRSRGIGRARTESGLVAQPHPPATAVQEASDGGMEQSSQPGHVDGEGDGPTTDEEGGSE